MIVLVVVVLLSFLTMFGTLAGEIDCDHDWARKAVLSGDAVPLAEIIASIEENYDSKVFEVNLVKSDDASVASMYRLKLVTNDGRLIDLLVDTASGLPVGIGGQGINEDEERND